MTNPRIEIDVSKLRHNTKQIVNKCNKLHISVTGVTKVFCGNLQAAKAMADGGVKFLGDSRIENIIRLSEINLPKVLLRLPMQSEIEEVVRYADYSLNSEISTISRISVESMKLCKKHKVILMVDIGDLREGIWYEQFEDFIEEVIRMDGIEIAGIGTNLTCYGGIIPSETNLTLLTNIAERIRERYKIPLPLVSGGNSSSLYLADNENIPYGINNLRIGEAIILGRETAFGTKLNELYDDAFTIYGEIIEIKTKPSVPVGNIGMDAFGEVPQFIDRGMRKRAIVAIGRQDVEINDMAPMDRNMQIFGASSDHLIIDITNSRNEYSIGSEIQFKIAYSCLLRAMTSEYVKKIVINDN